VRVFAIDPGNHCGFASVCDGVLEHSGTWVLAKDGEHKGVRFWRLFHRLSELHSATGRPDVVAFESKQGFKVSNDNLVNYGGFVGVLRAWAMQLQDIDVVSMQPNRIKLRATGHGHASKADMVAHACRRTGLDIRDDNEADAICLAFVIYEEETS
jgi:Holliday junction resolvasome RuvABC endonuclease subunit